MRICSLLPSATEIVYALGLGKDLVAVSHECDYPSEALSKPKATRSAVASAELSSKEINDQVAALVREGKGIYSLDLDLLGALRPDLIITQELCEVCAVSLNDVRAAVSQLALDCQVLAMEPHTIKDINGTILKVGDVTGRRKEARQVIASMRDRIEAVEQRAAEVTRPPRVLCLEWLDPPMVAGHWVPEMVDLAGGVDGIGRPGEPSFKVTWERIAKYDPEVIVLMPCGSDPSRTLAEIATVEEREEWPRLSAVRQNRVYAVNASHYFSRPGPRIADGVHVLAQCLHPSLFMDMQDMAPSEAYQQVRRRRARSNAAPAPAGSTPPAAPPTTPQSTDPG